MAAYKLSFINNRSISAETKGALRTLRTQVEEARKAYDAMTAKVAKLTAGYEPSEDASDDELLEFEEALVRTESNYGIPQLGKAVVDAEAKLAAAAIMAMMESRIVKVAEGRAMAKAVKTNVVQARQLADAALAMNLR